ncbi:MAG: OmpA family protein [Deltaproteobacteria bacterium]|nr:OmpA family protein [Deltaproteobacteria bacterium]
MVVVLLSFLSPFLFSQNAWSEIEPWNKNLRLKFLKSLDPIVSGSSFGMISDFFVDEKHNEIFVLDSFNNRIVIMNLEGSFLYSTDYSNARIKAPLTISVATDGNLYLSEAKKIIVLDYSGKFVEELDLSTIPGIGELVIQSVTLEGEVLYIGFYGKVAVFDLSKNEFIKFLGEDIVRNARLTVDGDYVYALDTPSFSVVVLDKVTGKGVRRFGTMSGLFGGFSQPVDIAIDTLKGRIFVPDFRRECVIVFNREGLPLFEFGYSRDMTVPYKVTVDDTGRIYVSDTSGKIKVFELIEGQEYVPPTMPRPKPQIVVAKVEEPEEPEVIIPIEEDEVEIIVREEGRLLPVYFEINSFLLSDDARSALTKNAKWLFRNSKETINIRGYADPTGTDAQNMALSKKRAQAVMGYLAMKGVDPDRLIVVPFGEVGIEGMGEEGMGMSRRVDFMVVK